MSEQTSLFVLRQAVAPNDQQSSVPNTDAHSSYVHCRIAVSCCSSLGTQTTPLIVVVAWLVPASLKIFFYVAMPHVHVLMQNLQCQMHLSPLAPSAKRLVRGSVVTH